jgi:hypothetical protein
MTIVTGYITIASHKDLISYGDGVWGIIVSLNTVDLCPDVFMSLKKYTIQCPHYHIAMSIKGDGSGNIV